MFLSSTVLIFQNLVQNEINLQQADQLMLSVWATLKSESNVIASHLTNVNIQDALSIINLQQADQLILCYRWGQP